MENEKLRKWDYVLVGILGLIVGFGLPWLNDKYKGNLGGPTPRVIPIDVYGSSTQSAEIATTTISKTIEIGESIDLVRTNIAFVPSSTATQIQFLVGYSWDGTNFFGESQGFGLATSTATLTKFYLGNATSSFILLPFGTEKQYRSFEIPTNGARFIRYSINRFQPFEANSMAWINAVPIDNR